MALVMDWQKRLGYSLNPFEGAFAPAAKYLVGVKDLQERLNIFLIKEERFGTITGPHGSGKTMILHWMNDELAPQKSHVQHLIDAAQHKREDIVNMLLHSRLSFFERKFGGLLKAPLAEREKALLARLCKEKRSVLLIDHAGQLSRHELEFLCDLSIKTPAHIILADTPEALKKLSLPEPLIDTLRLQMPKYTDEQLTELLHRRIRQSGSHGTHPFDEYELRTLFEKAQRNPARLLQLAQERAIELSLKVDPHHAAPAQTGKLISIKIEKRAATAAAPAEKQDKTEPVQPEPQPRKDIPREEGADLQTLAEAVDPTLEVKDPAPVAPAAKEAKQDLPPENLVDEVISKMPVVRKQRAAPKPPARKSASRKSSGKKNSAHTSKKAKVNHG